MSRPDRRNPSMSVREELHEQRRRGTAIAELLGLKMKPTGRYDTSWGDKTAVGLFLTVSRFCTEQPEPKA